MSDLCRLTVLAPAGRADFAVPVRTPVFDLLPLLSRRADPDRTQAAAGRGHWVLQRLGEEPLDEGGTPESLGLRDGEVLYLRPREAPMPPIDFDDVVDGVGTAIRQRGDRWRPDLTRRLFLVLGGGALAVVPAAIGLFGGMEWIRSLAAGVFAVLLLGFSAVTSRSWGDGVLGAVLGVAAIPMALVAGLLLPAAVAGGAEPLGGTGALAGGALATAAGVIALFAVGVAPAVFLGAVLPCAAAAVGGLLVLCTDLTGAQAAALVAGVAYLAGVAAPSLSARMVRIRLPQLPTGAADLSSDTDPVPERVALARAAKADRFLSAIFVAISVICAGSFALLAFDRGWAAQVFVAVVSLGLLLRSRVLVSAWQRSAAVAGGAAGLALQAIALAGALDPVARVGALAGLVLAAGLLFLGAARLPGHRLLPYWGRAADLGETLFAIAVVPMMLAVLDVYSFFRSLAG
ncbi:type VII secretion integral membrane protein EccD [Amycolatopsis sp. NPDC059027]|uniref:type VII secretion integral membrane protein EccD n=1 Tax=unclassified Amycolatopsis TaxID=2618356 RepID=UPI0036709494